jgi:hypothetical protein
VALTDVVEHVHALLGKLALMENASLVFQVAKLPMAARKPAAAMDATEVVEHALMGKLAMALDSVFQNACQIAQTKSAAEMDVVEHVAHVMMDTLATITNALQCVSLTV